MSDSQVKVKNHDSEHYRKIAHKILEPWLNPPDWQGLQEFALSLLIHRLQKDERFYKSSVALQAFQANAPKD